MKLQVFTAQTLIALLVLALPVAMAQKLDVVADTSVANVKRDYVLGAGDQIRIQVIDMEEISDKPIQIDPDGGIDLPLVGRVQAAGLTLQALKIQLSQKLSKYISDPRITLTLTENMSRPVSVIGEVNAPGVHQLRGPSTLIEVISQAGGVKPDAGSRIVITRQSQWGPLSLPGTRRDVSGNYTTATLSLEDLLSAKTPAENIMIQPNDVISVPKGDIVYVVGDVHRSGGFPLQSHGSISLLQAVSLAEGLGPNASASHARILRPVPGNEGKPQEIPVDVKQIFAGKSADVPLYANDILFIPNSAAKTGARRAAEAILQVAMGVAIYAH